MGGLLYKNIRQNRFMLLISAVAPFLLLAMFTFITVSDEKGTANGLTTLNNTPMLQNAMIFLFFFVLAMTHSGTLSCDESKKWAYFITSSPAGVKGQVMSRYLLIIILNVVTTLMFFVIDGIFAIAMIALTDEEPLLNLKGIAFIGCFFIIIDMIELPFLFRFGSKRGNFIKMMLILVIFVAAMIYALFGPIPDNYDSFTESLWTFLTDLSHGVTPYALKVMFRLAAPITAVVFILSYLISCKCFLKGIDNYDK